MLYKDSSAHSSASGKSFWSSFLSIFKKDRRKYGGLIAHLGVTLMFIGIVGSTLYPQDIQQELLPNEYIQISDVTLKYIDIETRKGINFETIGVRMSLYEKNKFKGMITPSMAFYENPETQTAEVAIKWGIFRDIYVALSSIDENDRAVIVVTVNPLTSWLWIGSIILFGGTIFALWPGRNKDVIRKDNKRKKSR